LPARITASVSAAGKVGTTAGPVLSTGACIRVKVHGIDVFDVKTEKLIQQIELNKSYRINDIYFNFNSFY